MSLKLDLNKMKQQLADKKKKDEDNKDYKDPTLWSLKLDKKNNGGAIIRFLPAKDLERLPFVEYKYHNFTLDSGAKFFTYCPKTIGKPCPICEMNAPTWKLDKSLAVKRMAKKQFISNILVMKETGEGDKEREGKVFKFRFGVQVWEILDGVLNPKEDLGEEPLFFFDYETGADFLLQSVNKDEYANYASQSKFKAPSSVTKKSHGYTPEELHAMVYSHEEMFDYTKIKEYTEIQELYNKLSSNKGNFAKKDASAPAKNYRSKDVDMEDADEEDDSSDEGFENFQSIMSKIDED